MANETLSTDFQIQTLDRMIAHVAELNVKTTEILSRLKANGEQPSPYLDIAHAAEYTGFSKSKLYKSVEWGEIPVHRPGGRRLVFLRTDLDCWLQSRRSKSRLEIAREASTYLTRKGGA